MDAVKELAAAAGMEVPAADPRSAEKAERANSLYDVMTAAADWYAQNLEGIEGAEARVYLERRGIKPETIKSFGLGYAPESRSKLRAALSKFGDDKLIEAGLLILVEDKEPYDRFRGRLMIPIRDARGRVIAFGGRILSAGEPKYLNSPDTPLFDKGRTLYNLDLAGPASRKVDRMIVVEGYMDVIALAQAGIGEAVAPLGTALTEHQLERLWRIVPVPVLCFDGDSAGQKASMRAALRALPMLGSGRTLSFATLPAGQDPDDLIRSGGKSAMEAVLGASEPLSDRLWNAERAALPLSTPESKAGLRQRLAEHAQSIKDPDVRAQYAAEFRSRFEEQFLPQQQQRRFGEPFRPFSRAFVRPVSSGAKSIGGGGVAPLFAKAILVGLVRHPAMILACAEAISALQIADQELDRLRLVLLDAAFDVETLDFERIATICEGEGLSGVLSGLINANGLAFSFAQRQADGDVARRDLGMAIEALAARPALDAALAAATNRLAEHWDETGLAEQRRLLEALGEADRKLAELASGDSED